MTWVVVWGLEDTAIAKGAAGLFFGNPFSCQKGRAQPYLFILPVLALPRGSGVLPARRGGFVALVPCGVLLEDVPKKAVAGRELLTPERFLVSVPWRRLQQGCVSPPWRVGCCQPPSAGTRCSVMNHSVAFQFVQ